jgi:hypothetical protein
MDMPEGLDARTRDWVLLGGGLAGQRAMTRPGPSVETILGRRKVGHLPSISLENVTYNSFILLIYGSHTKSQCVVTLGSPMLLFILS